MTHTTPIRARLKRNVVALIVVFAAIILLTTFLGVRSLVIALTGALTDEALEGTQARLRVYFRPIESIAEVLQAWGDEGLLSFDRADKITEQLTSIIRRSDLISSIVVADSDGRSYLVLQDHDRWIVRITDPARWPGQAFIREWSAGEPAAEELRDIEFDPRRRPWFAGAVEAHDSVSADAHPPIFWTAPYRFFTTQEWGLTAATCFDPGDELEHVVAIDFTLEDLSEITSEQTIRDDGWTMVLLRDETLAAPDENELVIGLPPRRVFRAPGDRDASLMKPVQELDVPLLTDAIADRRPEHKRDRPHRFWSAGRLWWRRHTLIPLTGSNVRSLRLVVFVPQDNLLGGLNQLRIIILGVALGAILLALFRAQQFARMFSAPIEGLVHQLNRISHLDLDGHDRVVSDITELHVLAEAQERMRDSLRNLLKLEHDLQIARQIQQRTFPRTLPSLEGYDIAAWSDPADETGGDTYDTFGFNPADGDARIIEEGPAPRALFVIADATGHGVGPAISISQFRAMLRMGVRDAQAPNVIARHINDQLCRDLPDGRFITAWFGVLDVASASLSTLSAGQGPVYIYRAAGDEFEELPVETAPFGIIPEEQFETVSTTKVHQGDIIIALSDGIYEAMNADQEKFDSHRVQDIVRAQRTRNAQTILDALNEAVEKHLDGEPAGDDRTAIIVKRM